VTLTFECRRIWGVDGTPPVSIQVQASDNGSPVAATTLVGFNVHKQETAGTSNDVLGARVAVLSTGFTPSGNSGIFYVIELDANTLPAGQDWVQVLINDTSPSSINTLVSAFAILSGGRFVGDESLTVTSSVEARP